MKDNFSRIEELIKKIKNELGIELKLSTTVVYDETEIRLSERYTDEYIEWFSTMKECRDYIERLYALLSARNEIRRLNDEK